MTVLLATFVDMPDGEPGPEALDDALADRGIDFAWACLGRPRPSTGTRPTLVVVRSTWDYATRAEEFLAWTRSLDQSRLLNGADVFAWNHDKAYLTDLGPICRSCRPGWRRQPAEYAAAIAEFGTVVVKPRVSAGGAGLIVVSDPLDPPPRPDAAAATRRTRPSAVPGSRSRSSSRCAPAARCRSSSSGAAWSPRSTSCRPATRCACTRSSAAPRDRCRSTTRSRRWPRPPTRGSPQRFGRALDYVRVDLLRYEDEWVVSELELIEPGLYLDVLPANAEPFADLVAARLTQPVPTSRR